MKKDLKKGKPISYDAIKRNKTLGIFLRRIGDEEDEEES